MASISPGGAADAQLGLLLSLRLWGDLQRHVGIDPVWRPSSWRIPAEQLGGEPARDALCLIALGAGSLLAWGAWMVGSSPGLEGQERDPVS